MLTSRDIASAWDSSAKSSSRSVSSSAKRLMNSARQVALAIYDLAAALGDDLPLVSVLQRRAVTSVPRLCGTPVTLGISGHRVCRNQVVITILGKISRPSIQMSGPAVDQLMPSNSLGSISANSGKKVTIRTMGRWPNSRNFMVMPKYWSKEALLMPAAI